MENIQQTHCAPQDNNAVIVSAAAINAEHALARSCAERAIQHAIRCGELLQAKKAELTHGEFMPWVTANCDFQYSTAARYMKAAVQSSTGVEFSTLSGLFPSGRKPALTPESPFPRPENRIPIVSGQITVGTVENVPVMILVESKLHPGFWHSYDLRDGTISGRPCRADGLEYSLAHDTALEGASWNLYPDDGELMREEVPYSWRAATTVAAAR